MRCVVVPLLKVVQIHQMDMRLDFLFFNFQTHGPTQQIWKFFIIRKIVKYKCGHVGQWSTPPLCLRGITASSNLVMSAIFDVLGSQQSTARTSSLLKDWHSGYCTCFASRLPRVRVSYLPPKDTHSKLIKQLTFNQSELNMCLVCL